jgi:hypothetical protein
MNSIKNAWKLFNTLSVITAICWLTETLYFIAVYGPHYKAIKEAERYCDGIVQLLALLTFGAFIRTVAKMLHYMFTKPEPRANVVVEISFDGISEPYPIKQNSFKDVIFKYAMHVISTNLIHSQKRLTPEYLIERNYTQQEGKWWVDQSLKDRCKTWISFDEQCPHVYRIWYGPEKAAFIMEADTVEEYELFMLVVNTENRYERSPLHRNGQADNQGSEN